MAVTPIGGMMSAAGVGLDRARDPVGSTAAAERRELDRADVGNAFTQALDSLQGTQSAADSLAETAATGDLTDIHNYTIAATEASLHDRDDGRRA